MQELPRTLIDLVSCYSPTGEEAAAVDLLTDRMRSLGFNECYTDEAGNAVGKTGAGKNVLVLLGHIDTVPGELPVRVENGLLYGRGTVDAKGPLACFVDAVSRAGAVPGWQFIVIGAVDEEGSSRGARALRKDLRPDMTIIGEPSGWERITLGYKGSASCLVRFEKPVAHGAAETATASEEGVSLWSRIRDAAEKENTDHRKVFDQVTPRLRGITSGSDGLTEFVELQITTRLPVRIDLKAWRAKFEANASSASVHWDEGAVPAFLASKNTRLVRLLLGSIRAAGGSPRFVLKSGTADMNVVGPAWGCPTVAYGPGDSNLDHTPDEHISLREYERSVEILRTALGRLGDYANRAQGQ